MMLPFFSSLMFLSAAPASSAAPELPTLTAHLEQDAVRMQQLDHSLTRTCTDRAEDLDGDGNPERVFEETTRTEWVRGREAKAILNATENGQDVTVREQEKLGQQQTQRSSDDDVQQRGNYGGIDYANPFSPESQRVYRYSLAAAKAGDGDRIRIHFEPKGEASSTLNRGEALVGSDGSLVSVTAEPSDYPSFVHFVHFHAAYAKTAYGPVQTDFFVDGSGGFLFVQKHYRERIHCGGFASGESLTRR